MRRDGGAISQHGWAFWAKDIVESVYDAWALWSLVRAGILGHGITALLGLVGGIGFALFSFLVPLTGVVVSMQFTRSLLYVVPVFGLLIVTWAVVAGGSDLPRLASSP